MAHWKSVTSEAELRDDKGSNRDYREFKNRGSASRKEIDWMVENMERIVPQLREQEAIRQMTESPGE